MSVRVTVLDDCMTFADVLAALYAAKHTGPVTVHFAQGHAVTVDLPAPPARTRLTTRTPGISAGGAAGRLRQT